VGIGLRTVELDFDATLGPSYFILPDGSSLLGAESAKTHFDFSEPINVVGFSGTLLYDRFYLTGLAEFTPQTENTSLKTDIVFDPDPGMTSESTERSTGLEQYNYSLTLGYEVWGGLSIFSGYQYYEVELKSQESNFLLEDKDQNYTEKGFFIGSSYGWEFGKKGSLLLSVAYAYLDAELSEDNLSTEPGPTGIRFGEFAFSGTSNGLSYGTQWSGPLAEDWVYNVGLKYQDYESKNNTSSLEIFIPGVIATPSVISNLKSTHTDTTFSVGVAYIFQ
jgi:hypothetical protein